jgi:hypothetical protein
VALIVLMSASGSPGVTSTALGLAMTWPRPTILVDADPTGSRAIAAGYFRGGQLPTDATIVDLALAQQQGTLSADLPAALMRIPDTQVQLLGGPLHHQQAQGLDSLWQPLAVALKDLERTGQDVIVDVGRLGLQGSPMGLIAAADVALLTTRSTLPALVAASSWAETLRDVFSRVGALSSLGTMIVGPGRPYRPVEAAKVLQIPVVSTVAWDPTSAEVFSVGAQPPRRFTSGDLSRSLRTAGESIRVVLQQTRAALALVPAGRRGR